MALLDTKDVLENLSRAKNLTLLSVAPLGDKHAIIKFLWHDQKVTLNVAVSEVLEYAKPAAHGFDLSPSGKVRSRGRAPVGQNAKDADTPYRDETTFRALLDELETYRAMADRLGVSENTISKWGRLHDVEERRPQPSQKQRSEWVQDIKARMEAGTMPSQQAMAEELGISKASVNRLVAKAREGGAVSYAEAIQATLVSKSVADTYEAAVNEWQYTGDCHADGGTCELCGKDPIIYVFVITNERNSEAFRVGSECIYNYAQANTLAVKRDRKRLIGERKAARDLELIRAAAEKSPWVEERLEDFERGIARYGSLQKKVRAIAKKVLAS